MRRHILIISTLAVVALVACASDDEVAETESHAVDAGAPEAPRDSSGLDDESDGGEVATSSSDEEASDECAPGPGKTVTEIDDVVIPAVDVPEQVVDDVELAGETVPGFVVPALHIPERVVDGGCIIEYDAPGGCLGAVEITGVEIPAVEVPGFEIPAVLGGVERRRVDTGDEKYEGAVVDDSQADGGSSDGARAEQVCQQEPSEDHRFVAMVSRPRINRPLVNRPRVGRSRVIRPPLCNEGECTDAVEVPYLEVPYVEVPYVEVPYAELPGYTLEGTEASVIEDDDQTAYAAPADVLFDFDQSELRSDAIPTLEAIVAEIEAEFAGYTITVEGHADDVGTPDYNQQLSEDRAAAVADWLSTVGGIESHLVTATGYGETAPAASNATPEGQARNRRVVITVHPE